MTGLEGGGGGSQDTEIILQYEVEEKLTLLVWASGASKYTERRRGAKGGKGRRRYKGEGGRVGSGGSPPPS